nr:hypothetical protein [uncultured Marvinbryantia sp.]
MVKMSKEDREYFAAGVKTANPLELLAAWEFVTAMKKNICKLDYKFMVSHLGQRSERLLRNVVENGSFEDIKAQKGEMIE